MTDSKLAANLECIDPSTNTSKYWQAKIDANNYTLTITWGRIGTRGQSKTHQCPNLPSAQSQMLDLKNSKLAKGYREATKNEPHNDAVFTPNASPTQTATNKAHQLNAAVLLLNAMQPYVASSNFTAPAYSRMLADLVELAPALKVKNDPQIAFKTVNSLHKAIAQLQQQHQTLVTSNTRSYK